MKETFEMGNDSSGQVIIKKIINNLEIWKSLARDKGFQKRFDIVLLGFIELELKYRLKH